MHGLDLKGEFCKYFVEPVSPLCQGFIYNYHGSCTATLKTIIVIVNVQPWRREVIRSITRYGRLTRSQIMN